MFKKKFIYIKFDSLGKIYRVERDKLINFKNIIDNKIDDISLINMFSWGELEPMCELFKDDGINMEWHFMNARISSSNENGDSTVFDYINKENI